MPTNQQRRDAERRRLQRQLEQRRAREAARKRFTLIASIVGTIVVIAAIVIAVVLSTGGGSKHPAAKTSTSPSTSPSPSTTPTTSAPVPQPTAACTSAPTGSTATFAGLTVTGATDLKHAPKITGKSATAPKALACEDLVVGKGAAAKDGASATVQYVGALYKTGKVFQSSWTSKTPATFTLSASKVIPGFFQGIAGAGKVAPMHVGGRRIIIMPAALAYGAQSNQAIPANSPLVFVVDLTKVTG